MCCVGHLGCEAVLIGPSVLERVLVDALPRAAIAPDRFGMAVPQAVRAWTGWLATRNKLADRSRRRLGFSLRAAPARFPGAWYGPAADPLRRCLEDLSDQDASTGSVVNAVIERRVFAVPLSAERAGGPAEQSDGSRREASELDAAVQSDRTLITVMEARAGCRSSDSRPWSPSCSSYGTATRHRCGRQRGGCATHGGYGTGRWTGWRGPVRARGRRREVCRGAEGTVTAHPGHRADHPHG
jgi:hypothetical protein